MQQPIAYFNGKWITADQLAVPISDSGFMLGVTVAEQLRTFAGKIFRLEDHLQRLFRSLAIVGVDPLLTRAQFQSTAEELVAHNHPLLAAGDDLGLTIFVTPGPLHSPTSGPSQPTVCLHTSPVRFSTFAEKYQNGESLATTDVVQISPRSWPPELKCRSRMHYFLADKQARERFPGARALMMDEHGFVTEATTANLVIVRAGQLLTPPHEKVLPGISLAVLRELAKNLGLPFSETDLRSDNVASADEVLLVSTSPCVLPATRFNGRPIGAGLVENTSLQSQLLKTWSDLVGLDIAAQAVCFSQRM